jgi:hypothetical protein
VMPKFCEGKKKREEEKKKKGKVFFLGLQ